MKKIILLTVSIICALSSAAQITRQNQLFESVPVINQKAALVKEIQINNISPEKAYVQLENWVRADHDKDPLMSSMRIDSRKLEIVSKSRVELILPKNSKGVREKMTLRYRIDGYIADGKCILEITELTYLHENTKNRNLPRIIRAEEFITDPALAMEDEFKELRMNTKKSTLYFFNEMVKKLEKQLGY